MVLQQQRLFLEVCPDDGFRSGTSADFNNTGAPRHSALQGDDDMKEIQNRIDNMKPEDKAVYQAFRR